MSNEKIQQKFEQAYHSFIEEENYEEALKRAEILCLLNPQSVEYHHKVAYAYLKQLKWEKAIEAEMKTLELDSTYIPALDLLAHAYGALDNWEKTGFYGHQALVLKDKAIPDLEHEIIPTPAPKNGKRIISFSLFGNNSKYIEPAVLNTQLAPVLFPGWTCRFYVDDSVSAEAIQRFRNNGAEVIKVGAPLDNWPGTMWRFLAINDPEVEYVIFRDADSIICYRDAAAVSEWIKSSTLFHTIR
ncbi:tetratricopeptide repeat protein, partial [Neisseria sp. P0001.S004]